VDVAAHDSYHERIHHPVSLVEPGFPLSAIVVMTALYWGSSGSPAAVAAPAWLD